MLDRLMKTKIWAVSRITLTRKLTGCDSVRDTTRRHHILESDDCISVYHTALTEADQMHLEDDISSIIVRTCGIEDARWSRLVPFIMRVSPAKIVDFLDKHNVRDSNGPAFDLVDEWEKAKTEKNHDEHEPHIGSAEHEMEEGAMDLDNDENALDPADGTAAGHDDTGFPGADDFDDHLSLEANVTQSTPRDDAVPAARGRSVTALLPSSSSNLGSLSARRGRRRLRVDESPRAPKRQRVEDPELTPLNNETNQEPEEDNADEPLADYEGDFPTFDADEVSSPGPSAVAEIPTIPYEAERREARDNVERLLNDSLPGWEMYGDEMPGCYRYVDNGEKAMLEFLQNFSLKAESLEHIAPQMKAGTTYCLDVKITAGDVGVPFSFTKKQNLFALKHHKRDGSTNVVYLILRVYNVESEIPGLKIVLNPWTRRVDDNDRTKLDCSQWTIWDFE
ncbi:hypothetical protein ACHAQA_002150 [Verticillium albo-atrum]